MNLLSVQGLRVSFPVRGGVFGRVAHRVHAVQDLDLEISSGETLALVGESGCGKSTTARAILRLLRPDAGRILLDGRDVLSWRGSDLRRFRREVQIVFQDPSAALNPRRTAFEAVAEGIVEHDRVPSREVRSRVRELFRKVGLAEEHLDRLPHEFSGGQRQRIGIARALGLAPRLLVLDEPVSALDVSVQAQVLNLLEDIQRETGTAFLFVAHDLGVVRHFAHRVAVLYLGRVVEEGPVETVCAAPRHPYTRLLVGSVPGAESDGMAPPRGELPSPLTPPTGCPFHPRCPLATEGCRSDLPELQEVAPGHRVRCPGVPQGA